MNAVAEQLAAQSHDPLQVNEPRKYQKLFFPYGFPAVVSTNSEVVMRAAENCWKQFERVFDTIPLDIRCLVKDGAEEELTEPARFRSQGHLISIVADRDNFASIDVNAGLSFAWATTATARNTAYLRYMFLEAMVYIQLEVRELASVHAACVQFSERGILLAGDSGAGKSSLAYACARRGWTFLSDDASALVRRSSGLKMLGNPGVFRFREAAAKLFPEFLETAVCCRPGGKQTLEVETSRLSYIRTAFESRVQAIVFLDRQGYEGGPPALLPLNQDQTWSRISTSLFQLEHPAFQERVQTVQRLLDLPSFVMRYRDLDEAVDTLQTLALRYPA